MTNDEIFNFCQRAYDNQQHPDFYSDDPDYLMASKYGVEYLDCPLDTCDYSGAFDEYEDAEMGSDYVKCPKCDEIIYIAD